MKAITLRNIPPDLAAPSTGRSAGGDSRSIAQRDLSIRASESVPLQRGGWSEEQARELEEALAPFGEIDPEMWK